MTMAGIVLATAWLTSRGGPPTARAARLANIWSDGRNGIQIQNISPAVTTITANFYDAAGHLTRADVRSGIQPGAATLFYLPAIPELRSGGYSMIISADREVGAIIRGDDPQTGAAVMYTNVVRGTEIAAPLILKGFARQSSLVAMQNTDTTRSADVAISFMQWNQTAPMLTVNRTLPAAGTDVLDLVNDPAFAGLPTGFRGWAKLTSTAPLGVQSSFGVENNPRPVSAYEGWTTDLAADTLVAPLVRNNFHGTTGISVVNPDPANAADVTVSFRGNLGSCAGQTYTQGPARLGPGESAVFYQGPVNVPGTGITPLPEGCVGTAIVRAQGAGKILGVVNDASMANSMSAYNAMSLSQGARRVGLPLVRSHHTWMDLVTGIQVMNLSATAPANVELQVFGPDGNVIAGGADRRVTIPAQGAHTWYSPVLSGLQERRDWFGSALVQGDQPLAVVVTDMSLNGTSDTAVYTGIGSRGEASGADAVGPGAVIRLGRSRPVD
jgi:hypothetical protein